MQIGGTGASILLLAAGLAAAQTSVIQGDYIEDRSNHVYGCYCEWSGESQTAGKEAVLAWHVRSGEYRGTPLNGVKMAAVIVGERTLSMGKAARRSVLAFDAAAGPAERRAAEALLREKYGALLGEVVSVQVMPIEFQREDERAALRIGDVVRLEMRKAKPDQDGMQGATLWFDPFIPLRESSIGTTLQATYSGDEFNHKWKREHPEMTGYFGTFTLALR
ncbi:MAG: DUF1326 domain-containing protein [Bryobacterales bacterium]|nr:DUF1326 domain-containing protein [Bryobacterales bacterium]